MIRPKDKIRAIERELTFYNHALREQTEIESNSVRRSPQLHSTFPEALYIVAALCYRVMKSSSLQAKLFLIWYRLRYPIRVVIAIQLIAIGYFAWKNLHKLPSNMIEAQAKAMMWRVKSVDDGDTLHVFKGDEKRTIKLGGINAPELDKPLGIESSDRLRELLSRGDGYVTCGWYRNSRVMLSSILC